MLVIKRDGREVPFNSNKIAIAISKAFKQCESTADIKPIYDAVVTSVFNCKDKVAVEDIQDTIENVLIEHKLAAEAKAFIQYRHDRTNVREGKSNIMQIMDELTNSAGSETQRENANINALTTSGTMLKYGSEIAKEYNLRYLIKPEIAKLHREGALHIH